MYTNPKLNLVIGLIHHTAFGKSSVASTFQIIISVFCLILNGTLLRLIFMPDHRELGCYRGLLCAFAIYNIIFGISHFLIAPIPEVYRDSFVIAAHGSWADKNAITAWAGIFSLAFPVLAFNFFFRLIAVKHPTRLGLFSLRRLMVLMALIASSYIAVWSGISRCLFLGKHNNEFLEDLFSPSNDYPTLLEHDPALMEIYLTIVYWERHTSSLRWSNFAAVCVLGIMADGAYKFMTYAAIQIVQYLRNNSHLSERSQRIHVQLFRSLLLQAIIPFFTSYFPMTISAALPLLGLPGTFLSIYCPPFCAFHPVADACIMLTTVSHFRRTLSNWMMCGRHKNSLVKHIFEQEEKGSGGIRRKLSDVY